MLVRVCRACTYICPIPTTPPRSSVAVVPETATKFPILTAREYAATGSHGMPLERRTISAIRGSFSVASGERRKKSSRQSVERGESFLHLSCDRSHWGSDAPCL